MPQRFLRPEIRTSERWNETSFGAQSLYVGLMTLVDDFGRYDGRAKLIHGEVFILRNDVKPQQTAAWLNELHERDLIQLFEIDGKMFLQISRWKERSRSEMSRFPEPPARESCDPLRNPAESCLLSLSLSHKSSPLAISHKSNGAVALPLVLDTDEFRKAWTEWISHRREIKKPLTPSTTRAQLDHLAGLGEKRAVAAIRHTIRKGWQGIREEIAENGQTEPRMSPQHRQNRINYLNEKKQKTNRQIKDPDHPPSWAVTELARIDAELKKL